MTQVTTNGAGMVETLREAVADVRADRVFGTPVVQGGTVVLPVARIGGGAGGGSGTGPGGAPGDTPGGSGTGFGVAARPLGVFVLSGGTVRWRPAVDVNRIVAGGQLVVVVALLVARALGTARTTDRVRRGRWSWTRRQHAGLVRR